MEPRHIPENSCAICRFVENGDKIVIDVVERRIELLVSEEELARRRAAFRYTPVPVEGYLSRYARDARSADQGGILE